jgi:hypothetical protein
MDRGTVDGIGRTIITIVAFAFAIVLVALVGSNVRLPLARRGFII